MIRVHHLKRDLDPYVRLGVTFPMTDEMNSISKVLRIETLPEKLKADMRDFGETFRQSTTRANVLSLWNAGGYEVVAEVEGACLGTAFRVTQNLDASWSREPPPGVTVLADPEHVIDERRYARKSSEVGDIFEFEGKLHVVDRIGFLTLGPVPQSEAA